MNGKWIIPSNFRLAAPQMPYVMTSIKAVQMQFLDKITQVF